MPNGKKTNDKQLLERAQELGHELIELQTNALTIAEEAQRLIDSLQKAKNDKSTV